MTYPYLFRSAAIESIHPSFEFSCSSPFSYQVLCIAILTITSPMDVEKDVPAPLEDAIRNGSVDKKILAHSADGDEALKAFMSHQGEVIELDEATNKRLLRKIDWNLMPVSLVWKRSR